MSGCCGGNGSTIVEAKQRLGMITRPQAKGPAAMADGAVRIEATGTHMGSRTYARIGGVELTQPVRLGNNTMDRYKNVPAADAKILVDAGLARYVERPEAYLPVSAPDIRSTEQPKTPTADPVAKTETAAAVDLRVIASGSITSLRQTAVGLDAGQLRELLAIERAGEARKGAISLIETLLADAERVG